MEKNDWDKTEELGLGNGKKRKKKLILIFVILFSVVLCIGLAWGLPQFNKVQSAKNLDLGQKFLDEGNYEEAIIAFNSAINIDDKNVDAYMGLGKTYTENKDYTRAEESLRKGLESTHNKEEKKVLYADLVQVYEKGGKSIEEIKKLKEEAFEETGEEQEADGLLVSYQKIIDENREAVALGAGHVSKEESNYPNVNVLALRLSEGVNKSANRKFYYALYKIKGSNRENLMIGYDVGSHKILNIWTYDGSKAVKLFDEETLAERSNLKIYENGTMYIYGSGGAKYGGAFFYNIGEDGFSLNQYDEFIFDSDKYPNKPYYNDNESYSIDEFKTKLEKEVTDFNWKSLDKSLLE